MGRAAYYSRRRYCWVGGLIYASGAGSGNDDLVVVVVVVQSVIVFRIMLQQYFYHSVFLLTSMISSPKILMLLTGESERASDSQERSLRASSGPRGLSPSIPRTHGPEREEWCYCLCLEQC